MAALLHPVILAPWIVLVVINVEQRLAQDLQGTSSHMIPQWIMLTCIGFSKSDWQHWDDLTLLMPLRA